MSTDTRALMAAAGAAPAHLTAAVLRRGPMRTVYLPGDAPPATPAAPEPAEPSRPRRAPRRRGTGHPDRIPQCACQWGPTMHCVYGDHHLCHRPDSPTPEAYLAYADSTCVRAPAGLMVHQDAAECGTVSVWLADRTCRWVCSCPCHTQAPSAPIQEALF